MLRVLVVDDSEPFVAATVKGLRRWGWSAEGALDGRKAQEILSSGGRFDGVLLDRSMPGLSGVEVLRWIRGDALKDPTLRANLQSLCVVMLTGYGEVHNAVEALKLGAFQYLEKPIDDAAHLRSILAAGIAWQRAHAMRRELLVTPNRHELFARVRSILVDSLSPDGVHIMFVGSDGTIEEIVGEAEPSDLKEKRRFLDRLVEGEPIVFEQSNADVAPLGPILPDAKTLMAVPVPGSTRNLVGVLDMESTSERAFDPCWGEVLSYLADLIGIALEIEARTAERVAVEAEKNAERAKVEQLGVLYREFRHSIATHAQIVSMQARELLETDMATPANDRDARMQQRLAYIKNNADIIEGVVQDLKVMSLDPPKLNLAPVDLGVVVQEAIDAFRPRVAPHIELTLDNAGAATRVKADRANLAYCLKLLIQNSFEAIEEARRTAVEPREIEKDRIELYVAEDDGNVRIMVMDSGVGFDLSPDDLFQPLFSTKTRRPMDGAQSEVTGVDRVVRILEVLGKWSAQECAEKLQGIRKGTDILIRDGDSLSMYVREGHAADDVTLGEIRNTAVGFIDTHQPLPGNWPNRGMGLHSVRRIIEQHGGRITASSGGFGKGATFTMTLPRLS